MCWKSWEFPVWWWCTGDFVNRTTRNHEATNCYFKHGNRDERKTQIKLTVDLLYIYLYI